MSRVGPQSATPTCCENERLHGLGTLEIYLSTKSWYRAVPTGRPEFLDKKSASREARRPDKKAASATLIYADKVTENNRDKSPSGQRHTAFRARLLAGGAAGRPGRPARAGDSAYIRSGTALVPASLQGRDAPAFTANLRPPDPGLGEGPAPMRAIILAAGAGTRLQPLTNSCPKCLVPLGRQPIIEYQIQALGQLRVTDIVLVVGYEAPQIRQHCAGRARFIDNPDWASTNSIYSLYLARDELDTDTFLFNCDIIFGPQVLKRMVQADAPSAIAVDSAVALQAGEMNVVLDGGTVTEIGKHLDPDAAHAQSAQLVRFDAAGARLVADEVARLVADDARDAFPTSAYGPLIATGGLGAVEVGDLPWSEIDSLEDYDRSATQVLPRLDAGA